MGKPTHVLARALATRKATVELAAPLSAEDASAQSMPDASPAKWHLAHTTWFFDRFVLRALGFPEVHPAYDHLFNSYYEAVGDRQPRPKRGLLTRPSLDEVRAYRRAIDARLADLEEEKLDDEVRWALELGIAHEQQHQELLLTDVLHLFSESPLSPAYHAARRPRPERSAPALSWVALEGGLRTVGHDDPNGFSFDNEGPRHKVFLEPFHMASRTVTAGEYLEFMRDRGYQRPELWLSDAWAALGAGHPRRPAYWRFEGPSEEAHDVRLFTLFGQRPLDLAEPACHLSYYEADAYARWAGARLPTEHEWEVAAGRFAGGACGSLLEDQELFPAAAPEGAGLHHMIGNVWEWTQSAYGPYPGYRPFRGAFAEYNGKFMSSQMVLRGGSCFTPQGHIRPTYRNFFPPQATWQVTGLRLAKDERP